MENNSLEKAENLEIPEQENIMGTMPVGKLLVSMSLPMIFSMLVQSLYNIVDGIFVARLAEDALTAVTLALPLQSVMTAVTIGLSVGVNAVLSKYLGEKNSEGVSRTACNGLLLEWLTFIVFLLVGLFAVEPFFRMQTSDPEIYQYGVQYQTEDTAWMHQKKQWKGLKSIGMEKKTIRKGGREKEEYRYYISSLCEDIELFSRAVRGHWAVESMHWHLDVTFKEDANTTLDKIAAQNQNIIRKWCLSMLKLIEIRGTKMSLRRKRFNISFAPAQFIEELMKI